MISIPLSLAIGLAAGDRGHAGSIYVFDDLRRSSEPRIVQYKKVETSLVYHVEMAQAVQHDLGYLIKFMRSAAEVKRITRERQLLKEFELQEEARRLAFLKANEEMKQFHVAATQINCLYRKRKAVSIVGHKKLQNRIEKALFDAHP